MIIPINLSHMLILLFICSVNLSHSSNISPGCFWVDKILLQFWWKLKEESCYSQLFWRKSLLVLVFFGSGFNCIFHWKAQSLTFCKSLISSSCEVTCWTCKVDQMLSGKSFMYMKNISGSSAEPWGTPDFPSSQVEVWSLRTTAW